MPPKLYKPLPSTWRICRFFWPQVRQHRALILSSLAALLGEVVLRLLEPWPLKFIFDRVLHSKQSARWNFLTAFDNADATTLLTWAALSVVAITGLRALFSYWSTIGFAQLGNRILTEVRQRLNRHLQYLSLSFHTKARTGDLFVRVTNDVGLLQDVTVAALLPTLAKVLVVAGMLGLMFWMNWRLALLSLSVLPLLWFRTAHLSKRIGETARKQRRRQGALAATTAEMIGAIKTVQALSLQGTFAQTMTNASNKDLKQDLQGKRLSANLGRSVDLLLAVATALVLWYGARLVMAGRMTAGDLLVFLAYLKFAYRPIQDFSKYTARLAKASAAAERVIDLLEHVPEVRDLPGAVPAPAFSGRVQFDAVTFAYDEHKPVLNALDVDIQPGQQVAVVGPSGSGKSTLVSLILRLYDPTKGCVRIDGQDIRGFTLDSLRSGMSVVLQDTCLFAASVRDNIAYAAPEASPDEIEAAARLANAHEFIMALPQGYATPLAERGMTLSHGERQRLAIARAAIRRASILILDEPTTGLDKKNERAVLEALDRVRQGRTTFLVTHDLNQIVRADLIIYLEGGRILEQGTHAQLMPLNGHYASLFKTHWPQANVAFMQAPSALAS